MSITIPFSQAERQSVEQLPSEQKALHLAVIATYRYLKRVGIPAEQSMPDSLPLGILNIPEVGYLRCCPVDGDALIALPQTVSNCIGQVLVSLSPDKMFGEVFGFWPGMNNQVAQTAKSEGKPKFRYKPSQKRTSVSEYQSLETLIDAVWAYEPVTDVPPTVSITLLRKWLDGIYDNDWQESSPMRDRSRQTRSAQMRHAAKNTGSLNTGIKQIKQKFNGQTLGLQIYITPARDQSITVQARLMLMNAVDDAYLPHGIQLLLLDESNQAVMKREARGDDSWLQHEFLASSGTQFSLKVVLNDVSMTEAFQA
ncbi:DUF1822 family protein [Adonisia turfae]|nr:DUF1822 family protein [Adonisia turfae]